MEKTDLYLISVSLNNVEHKIEIRNKSIVTLVSKNSEVREKFDESFFNKKEIGYIGESSLRFPWKNVYDNIVFGNENISKEKVSELIKFVGLAGYENHFTIDKSYGFNFRIALARSILHGFQVIFIDNSLSNIDDKSKLDIYKLLADTIDKFHISFFILSESIKEALFISDKIVFFDNKNQLVEVPVQIQQSRSLDFWNSSIFGQRLSKVISDYNYLNL